MLPARSNQSAISSTLQRHVYARTRVVDRRWSCVRAEKQQHSSSTSGSGSSSSSTTDLVDCEPGAFNFAPASPLDETVYGCHMPGFQTPLPSKVAVTPTVAQPWSAFMKQQQISAVIVLLGQDEIKMFDPPLLDVYSADGFKPFHIPARAPGNFARIMAVMEQAAQDGSRVVVHCTGGCHRVGTVLTAWIKHRHGLEATEAASVMAATAAQYKINREAPSSVVLQQFMDGAGW